MKEKAIAWLRKAMEQKVRALSFAEDKPGVTEAELENIRKHIQIIDYICTRVDADDTTHGSWIFDQDGKYSYRSASCSECGGHSKRQSNYCPCCGAKMDRGDNGE